MPSLVRFVKFWPSVFAMCSLIAESHALRGRLAFLQNRPGFGYPLGVLRCGIIREWDFERARGGAAGEDEESDSIPQDGRVDNILLINNQDEFEINEGLLLAVARAYRADLGLDDFKLDIFIEDDKSMAEINLAEFGKDKPTDIISLRENSKYLKEDYHRNRGVIKVPEHYHMGDIFLCPKFIKSIADKESAPECAREDELLKTRRGGVAVRMEGIKDVNIRMGCLLAHGILHLVGYDHVSDEDFAEMTAMEDTLMDGALEKLGNVESRLL